MIQKFILALSVLCILTLSGFAQALPVEVKESDGSPRTSAASQLSFDCTGCLTINGSRVTIASGAGGANPALSNLTTTSINQSLLAQSGKDLGSAANAFRDLFLYGSGTYGTTSFRFTGTPTAARTITITDADFTLGPSLTINATNGAIPYRSSSSAFADSPLNRLDANTIEQRNSTTTQVTRFFHTYTDASNNQGLAITHAAGDSTITTYTNGTGADNLNLVLSASGTGTIRFNGAALLGPNAGDTIFKAGAAGTDMIFQNSAGTDVFRAKNGGFLESFSYVFARGGVRWQNQSPPGAEADQTNTWAADATAGDSNLYFINEVGEISRQTGLCARVGTQFDKTDTTLANVTNLTRNVEASRVYGFTATLFVDASAVGGSKYAIAGTATATSIKYQIQLFDNSTNAITINARQTALGGSTGQAGTTAGLATITGTIVVSAAGTLTVQFAQNAANGTSSVLTDSSFCLTPIS